MMLTPEVVGPLAGVDSVAVSFDTGVVPTVEDVKSGHDVVVDSVFVVVDSVVDTSDGVVLTTIEEDTPPVVTVVGADVVVTGVVFVTGCVVVVPTELVARVTVGADVDRGVCGCVNEVVEGPGVTSGPVLGSTEVLGVLVGDVPDVTGADAVNSEGPEGVSVTGGVVVDKRLGD